MPAYKWRAFYVNLKPVLVNNAGFGTYDQFLMEGAPAPPSQTDFACVAPAVQSSHSLSNDFEPDKVYAHLDCRIIVYADHPNSVKTG
jgi:hypothetical protein